jgi:hypothetical protein
MQFNINFTPDEERILREALEWSNRPIGALIYAAAAEVLKKRDKYLLSKSRKAGNQIPHKCCMCKNLKDGVSFTAAIINEPCASCWTKKHHPNFKPAKDVKRLRFSFQKDQ